jgi:hypothetical protein
MWYSLGMKLYSPFFGTSADKVELPEAIGYINNKYI